MRLSFLILLAFLSSALRAEALKEYGCGVTYYEEGVSKPQYMNMPYFRMLDYNDDVELVEFQPPKGIKVTAIICERSSIVPYKYDFMALKAGYVMYVRSGESVLVIELEGGKFVTRLVSGEPLTSEEREKVSAITKYFQSRKDSVKNA